MTIRGDSFGFAPWSQPLGGRLNDQRAIAGIRSLILDLKLEAFH